MTADRWSDPWFCWGVLPLLASNLGFVFSEVVFEMMAQGPADRKSEEDPSKGMGNRFTDSLYNGTIFIVFGPTNLVSNFLVPVVVLGYFLELKDPKAYPSLWDFVIHFVCMFVINDFLTYWGHRMLHEVEFLWEHCHRPHHEYHKATTCHKTTVKPAFLYVQVIDVLIQVRL